MSTAYTSAPYIILLLAHALLGAVHYRSCLPQFCRIDPLRGILFFAQFTWMCVTSLSVLIVLLPYAAGITNARLWLLLFIPVILLTYIVISLRRSRRFSILLILALSASYLLLLVALSLFGAFKYWPWLFTFPFLLGQALRLELTPLMRDRVSWIGISVLPVTLLLPNFIPDIQFMVVSSCGVGAGYLWWWSTVANRSGYGIWLPQKNHFPTKDPTADEIDIQSLLVRLEFLLGASVAVFSRHAFFVTNDDRREIVSSINKAALELCKKPLWVDDCISLSTLLYHEMIRLNIAAIVPLPGWNNPNAVGGWLILGMPAKQEKIDRYQLNMVYSSLYREFLRLDAENTASYIENLTEMSHLSSQIVHLSEHIATVTAGESTRHMEDLRTYGNRMIADGVRRFSEIASQRRSVVTYLGTDRELIWSLRKKIPLLRYVVSVGRIGDNNDVVIDDVDSVKAIEQEAFLGWLKVCKPLRVIVIGRDQPGRIGHGDVHAALSRHEVLFVKTRSTTDICDTLLASPEQTGAYVAKSSGYEMEKEAVYVERDLAQRAIELTKGNVHKASQLLGVAPSTFARRLRRLANHPVHDMSVAEDSDDR